MVRKIMFMDKDYPSGSGGGNSVEPNPVGEPTDTLETIGIDGTIYDIGGGGGGGTKQEIIRQTNVTITDGTQIVLNLTQKYINPYVYAVNVVPSSSWGGLVVVGDPSQISYDSTNDTLTFLAYTNSGQNYTLDWIIEERGGGSGSSSVDYSTVEQEIGTWIDGKPLYQITLTASGGSGVRNIDISPLNIDTFCGIDSRGTYGVRTDNGQVVTANYTNPYSANYSMAFITSGDKRTLELSVNGFDISSYAVTITYTKTTD